MASDALPAQRGGFAFLFFTAGQRPRLAQPPRVEVDSIKAIMTQL